MDTTIQVTAPESPGAATSHKEDRAPLGNPASSLESIPWRETIVTWYAGGPSPSRTFMQEAARFGVSDYPPTGPRDKVRALALAGFDIEQIIAAVPSLSPVDIVDILEDIPAEAYNLIVLHLNGFTPLEIAEQTQVSRPTVYYWLNKLNLKAHKRSRDELTTRQQSQIQKAYDLGEPMATIARRFNVSYDQVRYAVRKVAA